MAKTTQAAAVMLLRSPKAPEVLLGRRAGSMAFLGNQWAFLGGSTTAADEQLAQSLALPDPKRITALRELFEETGILLGRSSLELSALRSDPEAFCKAARAGQLVLFTDALHKAGRYVTPDYAPISFDTQYYLAWSPEDAAPSPSQEIVELRYMRPAEAISQWRASQMAIPSPVRAALSMLAATNLASTDYLRDAGQRAEERRAQDPVDCGDLGGHLIELFPGVSLVPLRTPTLPPATHTNCTLFGVKDLLAVDPASPYPVEQRVLDQVLSHLSQTRGARLKGILLTHHHQDHVSGAAYLKAKESVPVYAHPKTAALVPAGLVDHMIEDGHIFEIDQPPRKIRAIFTPGHAPGHLCYQDEKTSVAAVGDMLASVGTIIIDPSEGDMTEYLASLQRVKSLQASFLIPAHGLAIGDPAGKVDEYTKHRLLRESKVLSALKERSPARPQELLSKAYDDTPPALYPLAVRSLLAHLQKLVKDGAALESAGVFSWRGA